MLALQMTIVFVLMTLVGTLLFGALHLFIDIDVLNNALIFALGGALWTGASVIVIDLLKKKAEDTDTWNA